MTGLLAHAPAFIAGWAGCCVFIALAEWLTDIRKQPLSDPMAQPHGDVCPWPNDFELPHSTSIAATEERDHA